MLQTRQPFSWFTNIIGQSVKLKPLVFIFQLFCLGNRFFFLIVHSWKKQEATVACLSWNACFAVLNPKNFVSSGQCCVIPTSFHQGCLGKANHLKRQCQFFSCQCYFCNISSKYLIILVIKYFNIPPTFSFSLHSLAPESLNKLSYFS